MLDTEVGARENADLDLAVDNQREADRVLLFPQEAERPVDGVDRPQAAFWSALV